MVPQTFSPELGHAKTDLVEVGCEEGEIMKLP